MIDINAELARAKASEAMASHNASARVKVEYKMTIAVNEGRLSCVVELTGTERRNQFFKSYIGQLRDGGYKVEDLVDVNENQSYIRISW